MAGEYKAVFGIDCGVSHGFGQKYPDSVCETYVFRAHDSDSAYASAMEKAASFADDYMSNPDTGLTKVVLQSLTGPDNESVQFDPEKAFVQRSLVDHLLRLDRGN